MNLKLICLLALLATFNLTIFNHAVANNSRLEEVTVISSRFAVPLRQMGTSVTVIDEQEIKLRGYPSLTELLRTETSVSISNAGGAGKVSTLRIRGEDGFRTLVLLDGVELSDPSGPQVAPQLQHVLTGNSLSRVEILRGPQGFIYGADAGGVINITTGNASAGVNGTASIEAGQNQTEYLSAAVSSGSDTGEVFVSIDDFRTEGFNARQSDTLGDDDGYDNTTAHGKIAWKHDNIRAQLVMRQVESEAEYDNCGFSGSNDCLSEYDQTLGRLSIDIDGERFMQSLGLSRSSINRADFADEQFSFGFDGKLTKGEYLAKNQLSDAISLVFGGDLRNEEIESWGENYSRDQHALFAEVQGGLGENFFYTAGTRFDDSEDFGEHFSSRISVAYLQDLDAPLTLKYRTSIGTGFRAPSLSEIAFNEGDSAVGDAAQIALKEEESRGADVAVDLYFDGGSYVELVVFKQEIDDLIMFLSEENIYGYLQQPGTTTSRGFEASLETPLSSHFTVATSLTYNDAETEAGEQRIRRPKYSANFSLESALLDQKLKLLLNIRAIKDVVDSIFISSSETIQVSLDDYQVIDLSVDYQWQNGLSAFGRIENLGDKNYQDIIGFNSAERSAYVGLRYQF